jgi:hypothetical protein
MLSCMPETPVPVWAISPGPGAFAQWPQNLKANPELWLGVQVSGSTAHFPPKLGERRNLNITRFEASVAPLLSGGTVKLASGRASSVASTDQPGHG